MRTLHPVPARYNDRLLETLRSMAMHASFYDVMMYFDMRFSALQISLRMHRLSHADSLRTKLNCWMQLMQLDVTTIQYILGVSGEVEPDHF